MEIKRNVKSAELEKFYVGDKEFQSEKDAQAYIKKVKEALKKEYYVVLTLPYLIEGRGYSDKIIVAVPKNPGINAVYQYLLEQYGEPLSWIQGVSAIPRYVVSEKKVFDTQEDLDKFLNTEYKVGIGNYIKRKTLTVAYINHNGEREKGPNDK